MRVIFGTCVSGNGHQTQSIAVKQFLEKKCINVICNLVGKPYKNSVSKYFTDEFNIKQHCSFDFVYGKHGELIVWKTVLKNILRLPRIILSFIKICGVIRKEKPDVIFNFYEPLVGLTAIFFPHIKYVSFGHQYAMTSNKYPNIKGYYFQKTFLSIINYITTIRAKVVALSYYEFSDSRMTVCPPILRQQSYTTSDTTQNFVLVYLMSENMLHDLIQDAYKHPNIQIQCFTPKTTNKYRLPPNLLVFDIDGKLFQEKMKVCKSVVCSGGFETSSEAIYQNKPLLMIPIPNHYEQHANCNDALVHNLANVSSTIDLSKIPEGVKVQNKTWFDSCNSVLENAVVNSL